MHDTFHYGSDKLDDEINALITIQHEHHVIGMLKETRPFFMVVEELCDAFPTLPLEKIMPILETYGDVGPITYLISYVQKITQARYEQLYTRDEILALINSDTRLSKSAKIGFSNVVLELFEDVC